MYMDVSVSETNVDLSSGQVEFVCKCLRVLLIWNYPYNYCNCHNFCFLEVLNISNVWSH